MGTPLWVDTSALALTVNENAETELLEAKVRLPIGIFPYRFDQFHSFDQPLGFLLG